MHKVLRCRMAPSNWRFVFWAVFAATLFPAVGAAAPQGRCWDVVETEFWPVHPKDWQHSGRPEFPETRRLSSTRPDLGLAFSGGGTRAMVATLGQLRGLQHNGWLDRARYVSAVSGGSWAVIPYSYYRGDLDHLLGPHRTARHWDARTLRADPMSALARRVVGANVLPPALREIASTLVPGEIGPYSVAPLRDTLLDFRNSLQGLLTTGSVDTSKRDKTYARILGRLFLDGGDDQKDAIVKRGVTAPYTWDRKTAARMTRLTGCPAMDFVQVAADRPFVIVGATAIIRRPDFAYPRLVPVEFTPLWSLAKIN